MSSSHFENVKGQAGYCGIWCGSCVVGNGALPELTRRYQRLVDRYGLRDWGPKDFSFDEFAKGLRSIQSMAACPGCLRGGGRENCELRACATAKGLSDCTECAGRAQCPHGSILEHMRSGALRAGLFVREVGADRACVLGKWLESLRSHWPQSVLFDGQSERW